MDIVFFLVSLAGMFRTVSMIIHERRFSLVEQYNGKAGADYIIAVLGGVSLTLCGKECAGRRDNCLSFVYKRIEQLCYLHEKELGSLTMEHVLGAKAYKVAGGSSQCMLV